MELSSGASFCCEMVQSGPVATLVIVATIFDRGIAIAKYASAIEATARRLGRLSVRSRPDRRPRGGRQDRNCVPRGVWRFVPPQKKSLVIGLQFSTSWSQRPSRRASEAIAPSASSPPDMTQYTEAGE